jgi:hypothetical protein
MKTCVTAGPPPPDTPEVRPCPFAPPPARQGPFSERSGWDEGAMALLVTITPQPAGNVNNVRTAHPLYC